MEDQKDNQNDNICYQLEKSHKRGKILGGIFLVIGGSLLLARELGATIPHWIFTWKMLLIALGLLVGFKHNFRNPGWFILILIGGAYLVSDVYPELSIKPLLWPLLIIIFGLFVIFKPRRRRNRHWRKWHRYKEYKKSCNYTTVNTSTGEEAIDAVTFMGAIKKNIVSKNFKGGEITVIFGGGEFNLTQADFNDKVTLDITQVFGGTKLIIPANWEIKSELVSVFGSIEDKRAVHPAGLSSDIHKILILKGTTFFGGIEIKSF